MNYGRMEFDIAPDPRRSIAIAMCGILSTLALLRSRLRRDGPHAHGRLYLLSPHVNIRIMQNLRRAPSLGAPPSDFYFRGPF